VLSLLLHLILFHVGKHVDQWDRARMFTLLQQMVQDGVFQQQAQLGYLGNLALVRLHGVDRKFKLALMFEVDLAVVERLQLDQLVVLGLLLGELHGLAQVRVALADLLELLPSQIVIGD